jgi:hypothetical protein
LDAFRGRFLARGAALSGRMESHCVTAGVDPGESKHAAFAFGAGTITGQRQKYSISPFFIW